MENNNCIEKTYCLYASDWHLTIMLLPFISKKLQENEKIYMKFENSIEDLIKTLTNKLELKNKDEINDISWNMELNDEEYSNKERIYIISGSKEYIDENNKRIEQYYKDKEIKVKIVNCLLFSGKEDQIRAIENCKYNSLLNTKGESTIST